jgi:hypothetical protein
MFEAVEQMQRHPTLSGNIMKESKIKIIIILFEMR